MYGGVSAALLGSLCELERTAADDATGRVGKDGGGVAGGAGGSGRGAGGGREDQGTRRRQPAARVG